jgi:serine/threonine protein kinase
MAPEVIAKDKASIGFKSDIWSLGITAIELAMGDPPHSEMNPIQACTVIARADPPELEDRFSPEFRNFVSSCLNRLVAERSTIIELLVHPFLSIGRHSQGCLLEKMSEMLRKKAASAIKTPPQMSPKNAKPSAPKPVANEFITEDEDITIPDDAETYSTKANEPKKSKNEAKPVKNQFVTEDDMITVPDDAENYDTEETKSTTIVEADSDEEDRPVKPKSGTFRKKTLSSAKQTFPRDFTVDDSVTFDTMLETLSRMQVDPDQFKKDYTVGEDITFDHDPDYDEDDNED